MKKVSIIVPVYNVEKYLAPCLESLTHQTLKEIEIICVDDGSTDGSAEILEEYKKKDPRFKIISQKNSGRSVARNVGLREAVSPYIMFCDADDKFDEYMCEKMVRVMEQYGTDLGACGMAIEYEAHSEIKESDENYYRLHFSGRTFIDDNVIRKTDDSVCNKIFRRDLIEKYQLEFPEKLNNEDYYFCNAYMSISKTCYFLNRKLYKYIRHEGSIMSDNFDKNIYSPDHLLVAKKLFSFYKKNDYITKHADLFWIQFTESFWFSYNHSARKYRSKVHKIAKEFILKYYGKYTPASKKVRSSTNIILHYNVFYKMGNFVKNVAKSFYLKVNFAYRQQEYINAHLDDLYEKFADLADRLDSLIKEE
ncbi:glycosyltransferase family 2 protein [Candidatus Saccharibacteria bacterium]|nr:glycosyltransferase family 2 protein [Candidatus Saccharibacteria bacterium]